MPDDEESDLGAISSVMADSMGEEPDGDEAAAGDPEKLVSELKSKLAELEASLRGL